MMVCIAFRFIMFVQ